MEKRAAAAAASGRGGVLGRSGRAAAIRRIKAREESVERGVVVDDGGNEMGTILKDEAEGEKEKREEEEGEEIGIEGGGGFSEDLGGRTEPAKARKVVSHGGFRDSSSLCGETCGGALGYGAEKHTLMIP